MASKRQSGNPDKELHQKRFLAAYEVIGCVQEAVRWARVPGLDWLRDDPEYERRFQEAREVVAQTLEDQAIRMALSGARRPVLYKGKHVYLDGRPLYVTEYSDTLLLCLLQAYFPEKYACRGVSIKDLLKKDPGKLTEGQLELLTDHVIRHAERGKVNGELGKRSPKGGRHS